MTKLFSALFFLASHRSSVATRASDVHFECVIWKGTRRFLIKNCLEKKIYKQTKRRTFSISKQNLASFLLLAFISTEFRRKKMSSGGEEKHSSAVKIYIKWGKFSNKSWCSAREEMCFGAWAKVAKPNPLPAALKLAKKRKKTSPPVNSGSSWLQLSHKRRASFGIINFKIIRAYSRSLDTSWNIK